MLHPRTTHSPAQATGRRFVETCVAFFFSGWKVCGFFLVFFFCFFGFFGFWLPAWYLALYTRRPWLGSFENGCLCLPLFAFLESQTGLPQKPLPRTPHSPLSSVRPPPPQHSTKAQRWLAGLLAGRIREGKKEAAPARRKGAAAHVFDGLFLRSAVYGTVGYGTYRGSTRCSPPTAALGLAGKDAADASETCE